MFFSNLVKGDARMSYAKFMDGTTPIFSQFGQNIYASDIVQMCIDCIATECSKLTPRHIRVDPNTEMQKTVNSSINRLFKFMPNELMITKDFIEKAIWQLYMNYNCFIYPQYWNDTVKNTRTYTGFYPLNPIQVDFLQDASRRIFVKLYFSGGEHFTIPYSEVIHLRKKFSVNAVMGGGLNGQPDNSALLKVLEINNTVTEGLGKAIKSSLAIRGIYKINTMLDDEKQAAERKALEKKIAEGEGGFLAVDIKGDYTPLDINPKMIDKDTMKFLQDKVLNYFGVSWPILTGDFTDEQYQAFYEKTLEPLIISFGQAFSGTIFTQREQDMGNEMIFYPQKLLFTNVANKKEIADILGSRGAMTNNELLAIFGIPPYEGGDIRVMSLNYIDAAFASEYQLKRAGIKDSNTGGNGNE